MLQTSARIVSTQPLPPEIGAQFRFIWASRQAGSSQKWGTLSQIPARQHTQINTL